MSPFSPESVGIMSSNRTLVAGLSQRLTLEQFPVLDDPFIDTTSIYMKNSDGITASKRVTHSSLTETHIKKYIPCNFETCKISRSKIADKVNIVVAVYVMYLKAA